MRGNSFDDILCAERFRLIALLAHRLSVQVWWHAERKVELLVMALGTHALIKGTKSYYLQSMAEEGETWARDIAPLHDYLETHFPEMHLAFSFFRDVTPSLAAAQTRRKSGTADVEPRVARLRELAERQRRELRSADAVLGADTGASQLLHSHLRDEVQRLRRQWEDTKDDLDRELARRHGFQGLQREYMQKGSAARLCFSISSNSHVVSGADEFRAAVRGVVRELDETHRYQVAQKLGGRLRIVAEESDDPVMAWIEQWSGGNLSPRQLERLGAPVVALCRAAEPRTMVTPDVDIVVDGAVKDSKKLVGARVVAALLGRLDRPDPRGLDADAIHDGDMPITLGWLMNGDRVTSKPAMIPLNAIHNAYVSGITGSGKSYLQRVLVEEAAAHGKLSILILDPRNQSVGLLVAEDRAEVRSRYTEFAMGPDAARPFHFIYFSPGSACGEALPTNLTELATGRSIVSFKGLDDGRACALFADILDAVFDEHSASESERTKLLILVEEAQRFTKKRVTDTAKAAGERAERALDRIAREGRKYGLCLVIVSQTIKDFAYESASIRMNTNTKFFLRNSDKEVDYADDFLGDGRAIISLATGTVIAHNASWGVMKIKIRPPRSKVWEFSADETRSLLAKNTGGAADLSADARRFLGLVREQHEKTGMGANVSMIAALGGLTSKRKIQSLIDELERAALISTTKHRERGQPRIILPAKLGNTDCGMDAGITTKQDAATNLETMP